MSTRVELSQLGPVLLDFQRRIIPMLYTALRDEVAEQVFFKLVELSPVGNPAKDATSGKYRASHIPSAGVIKTVVLPDMPAYAIPGAPEIEAVTRTAKAGVSIFIANAAAPEKRPKKGYAALLEPGRRQYSRVEGRRTMWIGSTQAPHGIYGPAVDAILAMRATIEASAIAKVKGLM